MNAIKYRVSLDMFDTLSQATIKAKKCDSACQIHITLTEHGKIYNISEGCYATFNAKKSDGTFISNNCTIEDNAILYDFSSSIDEDGIAQISACEGIVECEVTLFDAASNQLTSPCFTLLIDGTVYNGEEIVSSPNLDAFKELKESVEHEVKQKMDKFGEVTETDEFIEVNLTNSKSEYRDSKPIRFRFGLNNYFEHKEGSGFKVSLDGETIDIPDSGVRAVYFHDHRLTGVRTGYEIGGRFSVDDDEVANVGYVNKISHLVREIVTRDYGSDGGWFYLENNYEYIFMQPLSKLRFDAEYDINNLWCSLIFTTAEEGDINITFPDDLQFIGGAPQFGNGETWEIHIKNGIATAHAINNCWNGIIGDIEAVLDELHSYAESLKGGTVSYTNVILADSETGTNYTLSVSNGKVILEEAG